MCFQFFRIASQSGSPRCPLRAWVVLLAVWVASSGILAEESPATGSPASDSVSQQTTIRTERYLGVVTEQLPAPLAAQLKDILKEGQGLLITRVLPDSPAGQAGLQPFDVISAADSQPLDSPEQLKSLVTGRSKGEPLKLQYIRGAKSHTVDVQPGERTVSRLIHRHFGSLEQPGVASAKTPSPPNIQEDQRPPTPAYSVGVQTRDGRSFQVEVRIASETDDAPTQTFTGTTAEVSVRLKTLPEAVQRSVARQMLRLSEDRQTLRTVQFRFQPRRDGNRQVLAVTLRKPAADGTVKSFELQQPMGDTTQPMSLEQVLHVPDFAEQLKELDPAVREKIASTLKTASLPAATVKVEQSQ